MRTFFVASVLTALTLGPALAVETHEFTPKAIVNLPKSQLSVFDLVLGMTPDEVKKALEADGAKYEYETKRQWIGGDFKGARVKTTEFVTELDARSAQDAQDVNEFDFFFSSPASGNQLVKMRRKNKFGDPLSAPTIKSFIAALKERYGEPTIMDDGRLSSDLVWTYKGGKLQSCPQQARQYGSATLCTDSIKLWSIGEVYNYSKEPYDFRIYVKLFKFDNDPSKVWFTITDMEDLQRIQTNSRADFDALVKHATEVGPTEMKKPKL